MKQGDDAGLNRLLATYRIRVDAGEDAVNAMVRAARVKAVRMGRDIEDKGFVAAVLSALGIHRPERALWSALAGLSVALVMGISLGASNAVPELDEHAFSVDLDTVIGAGTVAAGSEAAL